MSDNRPIHEIVDEQRKAALVDRLQSLSAMAGELEGVSFVTARDIEEVFREDVELDYAHRFTATTPATGLVDMVCPACKSVIPDVLLSLSSVQTREEGAGSSKVKIKAKAEAKVHVCGQLPLPKGPVEVEGQTEAFEEADDTPDLDPEADE